MILIITISTVLTKQEDGLPYLRIEEYAIKEKVLIDIKENTACYSQKYKAKININ